MPRPEDHYRLHHGPKFDEAHLRLVKSVFEIEQIVGPRGAAHVLLSAAERALERDRDLKVDARNIALMAGTDPEAEFQKLVAGPRVKPKRKLWIGRAALLAIFAAFWIALFYFGLTPPVARGIEIAPLP